MKTDPRDPLHRRSSGPQQTTSQKDRPIETPMPDAEMSDVPDDGDTPEQAPQAEGRRKKRQKSVV